MDSDVYKWPPHSEVGIISIITVCSFSLFHFSCVFSSSRCLGIHDCGPAVHKVPCASHLPRSLLPIHLLPSLSLDDNPISQPLSYLHYSKPVLGNTPKTSLSCIQRVRSVHTQERTLVTQQLVQIHFEVLLSSVCFLNPQSPQFQVYFVTPYTIRPPIHE